MQRGGAIRKAKNYEEVKKLLNQFNPNGNPKDEGFVKDIIDNFRKEADLLKESSATKDWLNIMLDKMLNYIGENDKNQQSNSTTKSNYRTSSDAITTCSVLLERLDPSSYVNQPNISHGSQNVHNNFRVH